MTRASVVIVGAGQAGVATVEEFLARLQKRFGIADAHRHQARVPPNLEHPVGKTTQAVGRGSLSHRRPTPFADRRVTTGWRRTQRRRRAHADRR